MHVDLVVKAKGNVLSLHVLRFYMTMELEEVNLLKHPFLCVCKVVWVLISHIMMYESHCEGGDWMIISVLST